LKLTDETFGLPDEVLDRHFFKRLFDEIKTEPDKSPEPTAVGRAHALGSSVHNAKRLGIGFALLILMVGSANFFLEKNR
jgi:hypothetical protein